MILHKRLIFIFILALFITLGLILFFIELNPNILNNKEKMSVSNILITDIYPQNNATNINLYPKITVSFPREIEAPEQSLVKISFDPSVFGRIEWVNKKKFSFIVISPLKNSQNYKVFILYPSGSFSWQFTTVSSNNIPVDDQIKAQKEADKNFGQEIQNIFKKYPWYNKLPLQNKEYFVYFDLKKEKFIVDIYPEKSSNLSLEEQIDTIKSKIKSELENIGINIFLYEFEWNINSEL